MVESVAHRARKFGRPRTKALCLGTTGGHVSSRSVTPCPGVTKECDSTPLLITRGTSPKCLWKAKSPTLNITGAVMLLESKQLCIFFFSGGRRIKQRNYISFFEFFEDDTLITVISKLLNSSI